MRACCCVLLLLLSLTSATLDYGLEALNQPIVAGSHALQLSLTATNNGNNVVNISSITLSFPVGKGPQQLSAGENGDQCVSQNFSMYSCSMTSQGTFTVRPARGAPIQVGLYPVKVLVYVQAVSPTPGTVRVLVYENELQSPVAVIKLNKVIPSLPSSIGALTYQQFGDSSSNLETRLILSVMGQSEADTFMCYVQKNNEKKQFLKWQHQHADRWYLNVNASINTLFTLTVENPSSNFDIMPVMRQVIIP